MRALGNKVVNQHADIRLITAQHQRLASLNLHHSVNARHQALRCGLLIAARAVGLAGAEQAADGLMLQRGSKLQRVQAVIVNRIACTHHPAMLQTGNSLHELQLDMRRQCGAHALHIHLVRAASLRLDEELVSVLVGKAHQLRLDGRAVARADTLDKTVEHA